MSDNRNLIVGIDLGNEVTQVSYLNPKNNIVESIFPDATRQEHAIPTVLAVVNGKREWLFGQEAVECGDQKMGYVVRNFLDYPEKTFAIWDTEVSKVFLIEKFLRKVLLLVKKQFPEDAIQKLVVTIKHLEVELIDQIYEALKNLGILKDRVRIISHAQSYLYFALSQKKELWMNDVALFDLDDEGLMYYQLSIDRRNRPVVVGLQAKDFKDMLQYEEILRKDENVEYIFDNIASSVMHKQIISTVYLTGKGFSGDWIQPCLKSLCTGRRVFIGQNLYCFGACYAAREDATGERFGDFAFLSEESLPVSVSMKLYSHAVLGEMMLIPMATPWYEAKRNFYVILDEEEELQFIIRDVLRKTTQTRIISLEGLEPRMEKGTRLEVRLCCMNNQTLVITVKDMGFGEFQPSSNRIWEQVINV